MAAATAGLCAAATRIASASPGGNGLSIDTALTLSAGGTEPTMRM